MKAAFINYQIDSAVVSKHLPQYDEIKSFNTLDEALGFIGNTGDLYLSEDTKAQVLQEIPTKEVQPKQIISLESPMPEITDDEAIRKWLKVEPEDEENPMAVLFESGELTEQDLIDAQPEEEPEETPAPEPKPEPSPNNTQRNIKSLASKAKANMDVTDSEGEKIVGLNKKVKITPDMIRKNQQKQTSNGRTPWEPSENGYLLTVTSGFGGGGKTTFAYFATQMMTMALKYAENDRTKAILIEGDYGNPKLQNRLKIPVGQDLSKLANFLEAVERRDIPEEEVSDLAEQIMEEIVFHDPSSGIKVIACPYDKSRANPPALREALKKAVIWAQRSMGFFVVLDADTIGLAEGVELDLVEMSNRIVIIANTRDPRVLKRKFLWKKEEVEIANPNERSHIDDALVMIRGFTKPLNQNGFGIPGNRIRVFFNETTPEELNNKVLKKEVFPKNMVVGSLPKIPEIERGWAADLGRNQKTAIKVGQNITEALLRTTEYRELDQFLKATRSGW